MKLQTQVDIQHADSKLTYQDKVLFLGSCFSENIGSKMEALKFPVQVNPFGTIYNPSSIAHILGNVIQKKDYTIADVEKGNYYYSFDFHSDLAGQSAEEMPAIWNHKINEVNEFLSATRYLIITFGTAWVYEKDGQVVANCHQEPAKAFSRRRLSIEEIVSTWTTLLEDLKRIQPSLEIIFTVSPVRHWKDGAIENQLSKSTLLLAVDQLVQKFEHGHYFPAYEIMMDELRDYRFYKEDLLHPNTLAIDYIWEKFSLSQIESAALELIKEIEKVNQLIQHRVRFKGSQKHIEHIDSTKHKILNLTQKYPFLDFFGAIKTLEASIE